MKRTYHSHSYNKQARDLGNKLYEIFILEDNYEYKRDMNTGDVVNIYGEEAAATWIHESYRHPLVKIRAAKRLRRLVCKHNK